MTERERRYYVKVVEAMEEAGCICLEPSYRPAKDVWRFICSCGEFGYQRPSDFYRGRRCHACGIRRLKESKGTSEEEIKSLFDVSTEEYIESWLEDRRTYVKYKCCRGHEMTQLLYSYKAGHRCKKCSLEDSRSRSQLDIETVSKELEDMGLEFIDSEYINIDTPFNYRCSCGREAVGYLNALRKGYRCGCLVPRGEKSRLWNPDLSDEDRMRGRNYPEYTDWCRTVLKRDDYTCQKCENKGGCLHAHHIRPFSKYPELRTEVSNGITLCKTCHINFHWEYGYGDASLQDFYNFMGW